MSKYECFFLLTENQQKGFISQPEVFSGVHVGFLTHHGIERYCIVTGGLVATVLLPTLDKELSDFFEQTWRSNVPPHTFGASPPPSPPIVARYQNWLSQLSPPEGIEPISVPRDQVMPLVTDPNPPPPHNRPTLLPFPALPPSISSVYGHLPFATSTVDGEVFYRWESWPTSRKVDISAATIASATYAAPQCEISYVNSGFGAVGRAALPSFFPAVFRYEIKPPVGTPIRCGAIVPMYGQAGGGVEVYFPTPFTNVGNIADPVIVPPL